LGDFFRSAKFKILAGVFIVLLAFMLRAAWTGGLSPIISSAVGFVVTPLQRVSASISDTVRGYFERYTRADEIALENEQLRAEVNELRRQLVDYEQSKKENEMLKQFLDLKEQNPDFVLEPASVVARDPNDRFYSFTIDKGSLNGVSLHDPVVSADGLVGRVKEVGLNYSKVLTILDVAVDAGAYDVRTRDIGIIGGSIDLVDKGYCKMSYLPRESGAAAGDLVVTTGGGIFPKDLVIGRITRIADEAGGISLYAEIEPAADIPNLTDVMIIKAYDGQEEQPDE
jgi:rod shape-determining protein MreC